MSGEDKNEITSESVKEMSPELLALIQGSNHMQSIEYILVEKEWQRRERVEQHKLDLKMMKDQIKASRFAAIIGVVGTLLGVFLGSYLEHKLPKHQETDKQKIVQYKTEQSTSVHHKEKVVSASSQTPSVTGKK